MATEGSSKTIVIVVIVAVVIWWLLNRTASTVGKVNASVKQTYTPSTAVSAVVTSAAPALGSFLSNLAKGSASGGSSAATSNDASFSNGVWGSNSAFTDDAQFADYDLV